MRTLAAAQTAVDAGADLLGMVFVPTARRAIAVGEARRIVQDLRSRSNIGIVGVFVDPRPEQANDVATFVGLDYVQLSGEEPSELLTQLNRPILKAVRISADCPVPRLDQPHVTALVLEPQAAGLGGSGVAHNLSLAGRVMAIRPHPPVLLAGGLRPDTVAAAVRRVRPDGVDVSSGIERDGSQDTDKIIAFIDAARGAVELW
ncbi:MAG: phosphoribosylanthranilate isomerase [Chloroflexi bacterium]|nr:phosphoribosylanthranilate isomerase [Chloroflexota bacterium]